MGRAPRGWVDAAAAAGALVLFLAACTASGPDAAIVDGGTAPSTRPALSGPVNDATVEEAIAPAVALVTTPHVAGNGLAIEDGYLLTNAHTIDPFPVATVEFAGQEPVEVPVVGVDLASDLAVLGPVPGGPAGVAVAGTGELAPDDPMYLVGSHADPERPEIEVDRGRYDRRLTEAAWDLDVLLTDIGPKGWQKASGAVVDARGRVVGLTCLFFDERYSFAVAGEHVRSSIDAILAGEASDWTPLPRSDEDARRANRLDLAAGFGRGYLFVPAAAEERTLEVRTAPSTGLRLMTLRGSVTELNQSAEDRLLAQRQATAEGLPSVRPETAPGTWSVVVPPGEPAVLVVDRSGDEDGAIGEVEVETSLPLVAVAPDADVGDIAVGEEREGAVGTFHDADRYRIDLRAGEKVTITATSALSDMRWAVYAPGERVPVRDVDDSGGGVLESDASGDLVATVGGTYEIEVSQRAGLGTEYRLSVEAA